jgi:hypothetical protein
LVLFPSFVLENRESLLNLGFVRSLNEEFNVFDGTWFDELGYIANVNDADFKVKCFA